MNIFETVKTSLNLIKVAKHYGLSVRRDGFTNCIFHNDKHPSMKLYKDHYHCFACGAHGDVIAFAAQMFGLSPYEVAKRLAADFGIGNIKKVSKKPQHMTEYEAQSILKGYISELRKNRDTYRPCSPNEDLHPLYVEAVRILPLYEYYLDVLTDGSYEERKQFINEEGRLFYELKRKLRQSGMVVA